MDDFLESILVVHQNPAPGRIAQYDDWYTNIHIRDAMRLDGAIATQRFIACDDQLILDGRRAEPQHWAHTIYEWDSAEKSRQGHDDRAGTPLMEISGDGAFDNLMDYYYRPVFLSDGWSRAEGFRRGSDVLTATIVAPQGSDAEFIAWFRDRHAPDTLALPGFASVGLFSLHEEQSLPGSAPYPWVAIYSLSDRQPALGAWAARHDARSALDLDAVVTGYEIGCWQQRTRRLLSKDVAAPSADSAAEERRAREVYKHRFLNREELMALLDSIEAVPA